MHFQMKTYKVYAAIQSIENQLYFPLLNILAAPINDTLKTYI
jgi:hypothetical protein